MKALLIPANNDAPVEVETIDDNDLLGGVQSMVGGYVEPQHVYHTSPLARTRSRFQVLANEDGRMLKLPPNQRAFDLTGVTLVGNVVVVGDTTDTWIDVPDEVVSIARLA